MSKEVEKFAEEYAKEYANKYAQEWLVGDKMEFLKIYLGNSDFSVENSLDAAGIQGEKERAEIIEHMEK